MTIKYLCVITLFLAFSLLSCKKSTTGPNDTQKDFLVHIQVANSNNQPVSGLRVSVWNALSNTGLAKTMTSSSTNLISSATTINFALAKTSNITLALSELNNKPYATLVTGIKNPGYYTVTASFPTLCGTHVYQCRLSAIDTSSDTLSYSGSMYLVLHQPDPAIAVLGYTSSTGSIETTDSLWFPNLFPLPPLIRTASTSRDSLGTFSIPENVQICLTDTSSGLSQVYSAVIKGGETIISLGWNPTSSSSISSVVHKSAKSQTTSILPDVIPVSIPTNTKLYQNYPNPFN
jgi:hypothetical protein